MAEKIVREKQSSVKICGNKGEEDIYLLNPHEDSYILSEKSANLFNVPKKHEE